MLRVPPHTHTHTRACRFCNSNVWRGGTERAPGRGLCEAACRVSGTVPFTALKASWQLVKGEIRGASVHFHHAEIVDADSVSPFLSHSVLVPFILVFLRHFIYSWRRNVFSFPFSNQSLCSFHYILKCPFMGSNWLILGSSRGAIRPGEEC